MNLEFSSWFFCCSLSMLVHWFCLHRFVSSVRLLYRANSQNGARKFLSVLISSWLEFNWQLYLIMSCIQLTFKTESFIYFHLVLEGGPYPFLVIPHLRRFGITVFCFFFLIIFNYCSHSQWLADLYPVLWPKSLRSARCFHRLTVCVFV